MKNKIKELLMFCLLGALTVLQVNINVEKPVSVSASSESSISLGDIPYLTWYNEYGKIQKDGFSVQAKAGWFDAEAAESGYGLALFDTKASDNKVTCSTKDGLGFENYFYSFNNNSIVLEITADVGGTLTIDYTSCGTFTGWIDWNSGYIVRKLATDGTLTNLKFDYHLESNQTATITADLTSKYDYDVLAGEKIFIEYGASAGRNYQNLQTATISLAPSATLTNTYSLANVVEDYSASSYQPISKDLFDVSIKAGWFDGADAANKNLVDFDGASTDGLTCSTKSGLVIGNWQYNFNNNSVVYVIKAKEDGTLTLDYSGCTLGGWVDWNSAYIVRKETTDGTVSEVTFNYHISEGAETAIKTAITSTPTISLLKDEKVYVEFGASADRNYQGLNNTVISYTTKVCGTGLNEVYKAKVNALFNSLNANYYSQENYQTLTGYKDAFVNTTFTQIETITNKYNEVVAQLNSITPDELYLERIAANGLVATEYAKYASAYYATADYATITTAKDDALTAIASATSEADINKAVDDFKAIAADVDQTLKYADIPWFIGHSEYAPITLNNVIVNAYEGSLRTSLKAMNASSGENEIHNSEVASVSMGNWQYTFTATDGIIIAFSATKDIELTIANSSTDGFGWTSDTYYNVYLKKGDYVYLLSSVADPNTQESFSGTYELASGDVLFVEYIAKSGVEGTRNLQNATCITAKITDDYNAETYATQNIVIDLIGTKNQAIADYVATLNEEDYTEASWTAIQTAKNGFLPIAINYTSSEDVTTLYNNVIKSIDDVLTIDEAQAIFDQYKADAKTALDTYYTGLKENHYTSANLAILDGIYADNKDNFDSLTTAEAVDTELARIKGLLDNVAVDALYEQREAAKATVNTAFSAFNKAYYDETAYNAVQTKVNNFVANIENYETLEALNTAKGEVVTAMNGLVAIKDGFSYLELGGKVALNQYGYVTGTFFDYTVMAGSVKDGLVAFDTYDIGSNTLSLSTASGLKVEGWQWTVIPGNGVVVVYKANKNILLEISDVRIASKTGTNGWTDETVLTYYIVRNGKVKQIKQIVKPTTDADFSNSIYLKQGDVLYVEFVIDEADAARNTQAPYATTVIASETFDEDAYITQNDDLPKVVVNEITAKTTAIDEYFATLNANDYSEASYQTLQDYVAEFKENIEEEVKTVKDVDDRYDAVVEAMGRVLTKAQAQAQLDQYKANAKTALSNYFVDLRENHYTSVNSTNLNNIYKENKDNFDSLTTAEAVDTELARIKGLLDAVAVDTIYEQREAAKTEVNNKFAAVKKAYYAEDAYNSVQTKVNNFVSNIESYETLEALNAAKNEVINAINALVPTKEGIEYLNIPAAVKEANYGYVDGRLFSYTIKTGNVTDGLISFDNYDEATNTLSSSLALGVAVEGWKWTIMPSNGVVVVYKANANIKLTITDTRVSGASGTNGWSDDCTLIYYIVREDEVKTIKQVAKPKTDADYSGSFYLKQGDILYVEFNTTIANAARNTESPYATTVVAVEEFNEEAYIEQNHDLPTAVKEAIASKISELKTYLAGLNKDDYSLANYAELEQYVSDFESTIESKVSTVEDVNTQFNSVKESMGKVQTKAQEAQELQNHIDSVLAELKEAYEKLLADNKYTDENKEQLDKIYNEARETISNAQSKVTANSAKVKAIQQLNAIEAKENTAGCGGSVSASIIALLGLLGLTLALKKRKN